VKILAWLLAIGVGVSALVTWAFAAYWLGSAGASHEVRLLRLAGVTLPLLALLVVIGFARWRSGSLLAAAVPVAAVALVLAVAGFTVSVSARQPGPPGSFYDIEHPDPGIPPGTILRSEELVGAPDGARAWRIVYASRAADGTPRAVSGTLAVPSGPAPGSGRPIVAFTHGTVGIARNCAPSMRSNWPELIDGLDLFLARGFVVVATDYEGLGAPGSHPYLVGTAAAQNALDSVRAAQNFADAGAGSRFVAWGASQGGHSALFTGELAATYAPELELAGVVAAAPATDLARLFDLNIGTTFGNVLAAFVFEAWPQVYPQADPNQLLTRLARPAIANISNYCFLEEKQTLGILPGALALSVSFVDTMPSDVEPWRTLLAENTPGRGPTAAPILVAQGLADPLVRPEVTKAFVQGLCGGGNHVSYREYPGVGHVPIGPEAAADAVAWIAERFEGLPAEASC
jgi:alpha-beta hydrolase superfamily lysophospholipase